MGSEETECVLVIHKISEILVKRNEYSERNAVQTPRKLCKVRKYESICKISHQESIFKNNNQLMNISDTS